MKKAKEVAYIILFIIAILWNYGFFRGVYDAKYNPNSSLFSIAITLHGMNPISQLGYKLGIHTNPEIQKRINNLKEKSEEFNNY